MIYLFLQFHSILQQGFCHKFRDRCEQSFSVGLPFRAGVSCASRSALAPASGPRREAATVPHQLRLEQLATPSNGQASCDFWRRAATPLQHLNTCSTSDSSLGLFKAKKIKTNIHSEGKRQRQAQQASFNSVRVSMESINSDLTSVMGRGPKKRVHENKMSFIT